MKANTLIRQELKKVRGKPFASSGIFNEFKRNSVLYLMTLPGLVLIAIFSYIPLMGITIAFRDGKTVRGYFEGEWVGFENFEFFFRSQDASRIIFNTVFMNLIFIVTLLCVSVFFALMLNQLTSRKLVKLYQSIMFLPFFLSWVVVGFLAFAFLSVDNGFLNGLRQMFGAPVIYWYSEPNYWPWILTIINLIKNVGYYTVIYYAGILGIDQEMYEAAQIDGASLFQQIFRITLPQLTPLISMMILLQIGKIFYADFGLFYYVPRETGVLFPRTDVIDTYVFRALRQLGDVGMSAAVGLFQSVVGFVLVLGSNLIAKRSDPANALF